MQALETQIKPFYETQRFSLFCGDCRSVLTTLETCSVDSIVCDPPYELGFMGKGWDRSGIAYDIEVWRECLRVLKPGGHLLAFGGSRTYHRLACAIEDAGFEVRDQIQWIYGSGFPKSLDVSKAIDAAAGATREVVGPNPTWREAKKHNHIMNPMSGADASLLTVASTDAAKQWSGWATALKPAHEPIVLARKPLIGTVAENVLKHGTGGLNIDGCRIEFASEADKDQMRVPEPVQHNDARGVYMSGTGVGRTGRMFEPQNGRWPANVIHDGSEEVLAEFEKLGETLSSGGRHSQVGMQNLRGEEKRILGQGTGYGDVGNPSRFFYCAKASQEDRNEGLDDLPIKSAGAVTDRKDGSAGLNSPRAGAGRTNGSRNPHPTVKPTELMRYLCRLVTPPGGLVLDPFCGSGSTGKAAMLEGFRFIGIELSAEYCELAQRRIEAVTKQGLLFA